MHAHSSALVVVALAGSLACASAPRGDTGVPPVQRAPVGGELEDAISSAKLRFNTAARIRDLAGMAALFEDGAIVITPERDTIHGRAAIAERLAALAPGDGAVVQLVPRRIEACLDGATEFGGDWLLRSLDTSRPELARGKYALRWSYDDAAGMRVRTLVLHGNSPSESARGQREVRCVAPHVQSFAGHRFELSISPPHAGVWQSRAAETIGDGLRDDGFTNYAHITADGQSIQPGHDGDETESSGGIALRWRARPSLVLEVFAPFAATEAVVFAYDEAQSADVAVLHQARMVGALASWEWRRLRIGAGPVYIRSSWHEREVGRASIRDGNDGTFLGFDDPVTRTDSKYSTNTIAAVAEAGYTYPIASRVFMDLRLHYRGFANQTTRGTMSVEPFDVDLGGLTAALGFGLAF